MPTHEQLVAIFTEWDRRAAEGNWAGNPPDPETSAKLFVEIAADLSAVEHEATSRGG